jgi:hypothetical protein
LGRGRLTAGKNGLEVQRVNVNALLLHQTNRQTTIETAGK